MMKKLFAFVLAIAMCFSLAACTQVISAYDIAVQEGFEGTVDEWLESLKGADGRDGENANEINIFDIYDDYVEKYGDIAFDDFLRDYLNIEYSSAEYAANIGMRSAVMIESRFTRKKGASSENYYSAGSGVIYKLNINSKTYIITNYHVIYDRESTTANGIASPIKLYTMTAMSERDGISATFVGGSMDLDLAILSCSYSSFADPYYREVAVADSNKLVLGEMAIAVGNPLAEGLSVTAGVVCVDSEYIIMEAQDNEENSVQMRTIRVDTAINSGNSGGGLFNKRGELIGVVNAKTVEDGVENMGYAIPSNVAVGLAQNVIDTNGGKRCLVGISTEVTNVQTIYDNATFNITIKETIAVAEVSTSGLANGKLQVGDVLVSAKLSTMDEIQIYRNFHLVDYLYNARVGDSVTIRYLRNSIQAEVTLTFTNANTAGF